MSYSLCGKPLYLLGWSFSSSNLCPSPVGPKGAGATPACLGLNLYSSNQNVPAVAPLCRSPCFRTLTCHPGTQAGLDLRLRILASLHHYSFCSCPNPLLEAPRGCDPSADGLQQGPSQTDSHILAPPLVPLLVQLHFLLWAPFWLIPLSSGSPQDPASRERPHFQGGKAIVLTQDRRSKGN